MWKHVVAAALLASTLGGCWSQLVRRDVVLERSAGKAPDWASKQSFEKDGNFYVVGEGVNPEGYHLAQRMAKAAAAQSVAESVGLKVKTEFSMSAQQLGLSSGGSFIQDTVALTSEMLSLQGLTYQEDYREKVQRAEDDAVRYRVVSLFVVPGDQLKAAKVRALEAIRNKASRLKDFQTEADAKKLLEEVKAQ